MLVVLIGIVFAIIRWKRHPKASGLTIAGLLVFQLQSFAFAAAYYFMPRLADRGWSWASIDNLALVMELCRDLSYAGAIALVAAAAFSGRSLQAAGAQTKPATPI